MNAHYSGNTVSKDANCPYDCGLGYSESYGECIPCIDTDFRNHSPLGSICYNVDIDCSVTCVRELYLYHFPLNGESNTCRQP